MLAAAAPSMDAKAPGTQRCENRLPARQRPWKLSETRECGLVFIGRDVPRDMLKQRFEARRAWEHAN